MKKAIIAIIAILLIILLTATITAAITVNQQSDETIERIDSKIRRYGK